MSLAPVLSNPGVSLADHFLGFARHTLTNHVIPISSYGEEWKRSVRRTGNSDNKNGGRDWAGLESTVAEITAFRH